MIPSNYSYREYPARRSHFFDKAQSALPYYLRIDKKNLREWDPPIVGLICGKLLRALMGINHGCEV